MQAVLKATDVAAATLPQGKTDRKKDWDEKALEMWRKQSETQGAARIALSKQFYAYLKKTKAMQKLQECVDIKKGLFGTFSKPPSKRVLLVDEKNNRLQPMEAITILEDTLGAKIAVTKEGDWVDNIFTLGGGIYATYLRTLPYHPSRITGLVLEGAAN
eukprot:1843984-Amphidinium_carterae.2